MPKHEKLDPKAIANRQKSVGLQKLRWYCQMCQKQCRDENGFKCHTTSESHLRQMRIFAENPNQMLDEFSVEFERGYMEILNHRHGTKRVLANKVYQEYIADKQHIHMNSTQWLSLTEFCIYLGREGKAVVDETEKGWYIQYIDRDPRVLARQLEAQQRQRSELTAEERKKREIQQQIAAAERKMIASSGTEPGVHVEEGSCDESKNMLIRSGNDDCKISLSLTANSGSANLFSSSSVGGANGNAFQIPKKRPAASAFQIEDEEEEDEKGEGADIALANKGKNENENIDTKRMRFGQSSALAQIMMETESRARATQQRQAQQQLENQQQRQKQEQLREDTNGVGFGRDAALSSSDSRNSDTWRETADRAHTVTGRNERSAPYDHSTHRAGRDREGCGEKPQEGPRDYVVSREYSAFGACENSREESKGPSAAVAQARERNGERRGRGESGEEVGKEGLPSNGKTAEGWLHRGILVKVVDKAVSDGAYFKRKGQVLRVLSDHSRSSRKEHKHKDKHKHKGKHRDEDRRDGRSSDREEEEAAATAIGGGVSAEVEFELDGGKIRTKTLRQDQLETVIPKEGGRAMLLRGAWRGERVEVVRINIDDFNCDVRLLDSKRHGNGLEKGGLVRGVEYEDISKLA